MVVEEHNLRIVNQIPLKSRICASPHYQRKTQSKNYYRRVAEIPYKHHPITYPSFHKHHQNTTTTTKGTRVEVKPRIGGKAVYFK